MPSSIILIIGFCLLCLIAWIAGELRGWRVVRISCVVLMLISAMTFAYGLGQFSGATQASIQITGATHGFLAESVELIEADQPERVYAELSAVVKRTNQTYEYGTYVEEMKQARSRLSSD